MEKDNKADAEKERREVLKGQKEDGLDSFISYNMD
jgi:hypothetical protein